MGLIDWSKTAAKLYNFVRGQTHPYPGAFTYNAMDTVRVWHADVVHDTRIDDVPGRVVEQVGDDTCVVQTGEGLLKVELENEDGNHPVTVGDRLGCTF
jgi:methionyl-tRNA formyltransferase